MGRRSLGLIAPLALIVASCGRIGEHREPWCRPVPATTLIAQSVPSASLVPCVRELPEGWTFAGFTASDEGASFTLAGPEGSNARAEVGFVGRCDGAAGTSVRSDERETDLLEEVRRRSPYTGRWTYRFEGGCASVDLTLAPDGNAADLAAALSFVPRSTLT